MILVGRYLSPFTRRTAIVLKTLNIDFEVKTLPATPATAELVTINPLGRVPAVVLDDGEVLIDSAAIIDHLLEVGDPDNTLLAAGGSTAARSCAWSASPRAPWKKPSAWFTSRTSARKAAIINPGWIKCACKRRGFDYLEKAATGRAWLHGDGLTLADVNAVAAYDFAGYLPLCQDLVAGGKYPALAELSARCNALPAFAETAWSG